jgi:hypothetical protein
MALSNRLGANYWNRFLANTGVSAKQSKLNQPAIDGSDDDDDDDSTPIENSDDDDEYVEDEDEDVDKSGQKQETRRVSVADVAQRAMPIRVTQKFQTQFTKAQPKEYSNLERELSEMDASFATMGVSAPLRVQGACLGYTVFPQRRNDWIKIDGVPYSANAIEMTAGIATLRTWNEGEASFSKPRQVNVLKSIEFCAQVDLQRIQVKDVHVVCNAVQQRPVLCQWAMCPR